jgi:hypothetical protein
MGFHVASVHSIAVCELIPSTSLQRSDTKFSDFYLMLGNSYRMDFFAVIQIICYLRVGSRWLKTTTCCAISTGFYKIGSKLLKNNSCNPMIHMPLLIVVKFVPFGPCPALN